MNPIQSRLQAHAPLILDGALATELERKGCDLNDSLWSAKILIEQPELIQQVHLDYFQAGADCATTASYQTTIDGFAEKGYTKEEAIELMKRSVTLAKEACEQFWQDETQRKERAKPFVAGSVGPFGAYLSDGSEYKGNYGLTEQELIDFHRPRIQALVEAGADILACETIPCLIEAIAIAKLLEDEFSGVYAWITFSAKDGQHISEGDLLRDCVQALEPYEQIAAVGVNCTPPQYMSSLIHEMKKGTIKPIVVYPNSGELYDPEEKVWSGDTSHHTFGECAQQWYKDGAQIIGGCCRTTPEDITDILKQATS
ncbi:homocysteine S-methyltransferase [Bacillus altitudinis]|uniref:homocysteine S-methyltransferase n=1 Tax=Bacillus altitudinis TaxID=293387 RepID=UPI0022818D5C|nr:homocysteine S-methyltransferase [Bacillus altitudinis]MCY7532734.1 homocysteine S-methyltransferase [Bacillus altitudinis]